jgi:hypothetical protein
MFCDRCGRPFTASEAFCAACGKPLQMVPASRRGPGRIESHVRTLGIFWIAYSLFRMAGGWFLSRFFTHWGSFFHPDMPFFIPGLLHGIGVFLTATGILGLIAGWGLMERQPWARTLAIVAGFFALFHFGVGTVLGIYTLWVLLPQESAMEYQQTARAM